MVVRSDVDVKDIHLLSVVNFVMDLFLFCALDESERDDNQLVLSLMFLCRC